MSERDPARHSSPRPVASLASVVAAILFAVVAADCSAIEMFTFFGDGSRIGLPSLEVPVEAYPGIPLRSDRLRARRRAMRTGPAAEVPVGPPGMPNGITIRAMPPLAAPQPVPRMPASPRTVQPRTIQPRTIQPRQTAAQGRPPVAPMPPEPPAARPAEVLPPIGE
jgi:hypothetical protein